MHGLPEFIHRVGGGAVIPVIMGLTVTVVALAGIALLALADNETRPARVVLLSHGAAALFAIAVAFVWAVNELSDRAEACAQEVRR